MALPPDELRKRIPQWSLESDGQLLQYMVQISKNLEQKCKQTQDNLNGLLLQLDESHIRFANAANGFNGVQQFKFVENRVKDDDESFYSVREEVEEPGERLLHGEVFQMAVEKSVANMYKCFEKVTVELGSDSDSEDDEEEAAVRNTVLRAVQKYPYIRRPLPYIIGSREWREKWHAGLIDSEEESETETKEQYSDSSDETDDGMFPSQANSNHTPSESEGSVWGVHADPRRRAASIDPSVSGDDTMSVHSTVSASRPSSTRRLPMPQHKVPVLPTAAAPSFRPPSLFPEQPPPDDTVSVKPANLFEESDEEESTPTHQPVAQQPVSSYFKGNQQQPRKTVNLFEDEPPPADPELTPSTSNGSQQSKKPLNLFVESEDEDDSFNNNLVSPKLPASSAKKLTKLFDEVDDDAVNNNPSDRNEDLFVPVEKSINGLTEGVRRIANLFDDEPPEDDFDEIFMPKTKTSNRKVVGGKLVLPPVASKSVVETKAAVTTPAKKEVEVTPKKSLNLFDDDDDDQGDIFKPSVTEERNPVPMSTAKPKLNLFDDESGDEVAPLPAIVPNSKPVSEPSIRAEILKKKSIFDTDSSDEGEDEDALFGSKSGKTAEQTKDPEPLPRKNENVTKPVLPEEPPIPEVSPVKEKPKIPDEPPEVDDTWEQEVPPDDHYPHVANDIDYFLTTNTISSAPKEPVEKMAEETPKVENLSGSAPEPKSALNFNTLGLFDDVPPPDDDFDAPAQSSNDHGDDFFGSRQTGGNTSSSSANRYLFMDDDGPPPDDRDEVDDRKDPVPTKISAIIDEMRHKSEETPREKPKINRLSAKVNINVNALLPGARRPAPAAVVVEESEVPKPSATEEAVKAEPPKPPEVGTGKLTQLNKGRAKIQTKRKPSTRQTRKANYENNSEQNNEPAEETRVVVGSEVRPQHVEVIAAHLQINQLLSGELPKELAHPKLPEVKQDANVTVSEPKKPAAIATTPKIQSSSKLFSDDESEDDDLFGKLAKTVPAKPAPPKQVAPVVVATPSAIPKKQSIFTDSDDDELFSKSKSAPKVNSVTTAASSKPNPTGSKVRSIFGSDEDSEGDDIFGSSKKAAPPKLNVVEKKPSVSMAAPTKSLFGDDDEDDEDDLFGSKSKITSKPSQPAAVRKPDKPAATSAPTDDPLADLLRS